MTIQHFLYKNIRLSLLLENVSQRQGDVDRLRHNNQRLLYWPFLKPRCDTIFRAWCLCFLTKGSQLGYARRPPGSLFLWLLAGRESVTVWLTVWRGYPCIYNFITPTHSFGSGYTWSYSACLPTWVDFLFTQLEHPVPKIPDWGLCQRSICNT